MSHVQDDGKGPRRRQASLTADQRLDAQERQIADLLREMKAMRRTPEAAETTGGDEPAGQNTDKPWPCRKCGRWLGFYDETVDVLRVRYQRHVFYTRIGVGGFIESICWGCAEVNRLEYVVPGGAQG